MRPSAVLHALGALALAAPLAHAATLCVTTTGGAGCYSRISDAVSAAVAGDVVNVGPGVYREGVTVAKSISLAGDRAIIDATGASRGIWVNGLFTPGLSNVHVSGFTVKNANFEGILVLNASAVTVSGNTVMNNNLALSNGSCPGLESFEPGEQQDCGEGVHVQGADHSIVTNNMITGNAGGILVSDDSGATFNNLISYNTVRENPYACGITLASHVPAAVTGSQVSLGVHHNTVYGNRVMRNGNGAGGGAGVGIFASIPGAKTYGNVVANNYLAESGHPGVSFHAHAPNQSLNDNTVVGNTIVNNGGDTGDAATPGPTGVNLYSLGPVAGNMISGNSISNESYDVVVKNPAPVQVNFNNLFGNGVGLTNLGVGSVDATSNFWSCPNGPTLPGSCSSVSGLNVQWMPWLDKAAPVAVNF